jgi:acetylornithine aminotransferase
MVGVELDRDCAELKADALEAGVIINVTRGRTVRLLPPLIVSDDEVDRIAEVVVGCIRKRYCP